MKEMNNRYLKLLNFETTDEAYTRVKDLASNLNDQEHQIRSCIFDLHAAIELELRRIYYHTFLQQLFLTKDEARNGEVKANLTKAIDRIGFMEMFRVLRPVLLSWPQPEYEAFQAINEARNQAAHGDVSAVSYKGRNPFKDGDCFAQMYFDVWAIKQSIPKFFYYAFEHKKDALRRYIDKYGPD